MRLLVHVALSILVAAALTALVLWVSHVSVHDVLAALGRLRPTTYLTALGLHVALYLLRTWRFAVLLPRDARPRAAPFVAVCAAHTLAAFVLPAKIGEATFVVYSGRVCGVPAHAAIAALVVSRLLDLAVLALGFGCASIVLHAAGAWPELAWLLPLGIALCAGSIVLFALSARGDLLVRAATRIARILGAARWSIGARILARASDVASALREAGGRGPLVAAASISLLVWASIFLFCAVLARGLGLPETTSLAEATFGASLAILTSLLPVSAFANFGTLELGWVLGFGVLGADRDLAAATGVGLHAVQLVNVVALGLLGHAGMAWWRARSARRAN